MKKMLSSRNGIRGELAIGACGWIGKIFCFVWVMILGSGVGFGEDRVWRLLAVGDSITQGGSTFSNWRYDLWERLTAAGYRVRYVGSQVSGSRVGPLAHEGHGGKNAEFLAERLKGKAKEMAADVVLLHAGHNHFAEERPVTGIVAAHESIIKSVREANPRVTVLVAKVITSSKLPKYGYLPELNEALVKMVKRMDTAESRVRVVDQASGFVPGKDTVADGVHPNEAGAAKMAGRWNEALREVLPKPNRDVRMPRLLPYKEVAGKPLMLHVMVPPEGAGDAPAKGRPAIVFFFGGGWSSGTPLQYYEECRHFSRMGWVAIAADYRIAATHRSSPFDAVADAKSAMRHVRAKANELGVDAGRVVAAGASAGGHLAAATCLPGLDDAKDDLRVSARADALVLWYPVIDNGPGGYGHGRVGGRYVEISPIHNIGAGYPPTLVLLGTKDKYVPVETMDRFAEKVRSAGGRCEVKLFPGLGHPIYAWRDEGVDALRAECLTAAGGFLGSVFPGAAD
jgi:acetyl esterase/lipase